MLPNETHPLTGTRILVGRARHQAGSLSASLRSLGASVIEIPFIEIRPPQSFAPLDAALANFKTANFRIPNPHTASPDYANPETANPQSANPQTYDWLILTSVNGVEALWQRLRKLRIPRTRLKHLQIAAIGPATKRAIVKHGLKVKMMPEEYVAEAVVKGLHDKVNGKRVLLVRAKVARDVIPDSLRQAGAHVDVVEAYETVVPEKSRTRLRALFKNPRRRPHLVTFTSSSTVRNFADLLGASQLRKFAAQAARNNIQFASIGPVTSATLRELDLPVSIEAREFTMGGLIRAIVLARYAKADNKVEKEADKKAGKRVDKSVDEGSR